MIAMERPSSIPATGPLSSSEVAVLHIGFAFSGVVTTLLGPLLPVLSSKWALSDTQAGYLFVAQFLGSTVGVILCGVFISRRGFRRSLQVGYGLLAAGMAALGIMAWPALLGAVSCYGLGLGLTLPATNVLVSEMNPQRRAAALSVLNLLWSIGAVVSPPLVAALILPGARTGRLLGLAAMCAGVALCLPQERASAGDRSSDGRVAARFRLHDGLPRLTAVFGAMFFLYVGAENAVAGWAATLAHRLSQAPGVSWELAPSLFWFALLLGRAVTPKVLRHVPEPKLCLAGLLTACLGVAALLASNTVLGAFIGVSLAGLGLASVFPILIAALTRRFGSSAYQVAGPMFALAGLGGAVLPWMVGFLSSQLGSLRAGLAIPLLATLTMVVLQLTSE